MRVFFALLPDENTKAKLIRKMRQIEQSGYVGRFTLRDNLHVTVEFIGEVEPATLSTLETVLEGIQHKPMTVQTDHFGFFQTKGSNAVLALHLVNQEDLSNLNALLRAALLEVGIPFQDRPYSPHLTLARHFIKDDFDVSEPFRLTMTFSKLSLMESKQSGGVLTYIERKSIAFE
ncbi:MAG: RNA 2',3'-cyclic phosphodiesterase [Candidatus Izemoplasmatales bacterium]|nr:RNA 2',3'-cyclic phosphodiesterase [Candidatus Izemoplasmatales bacterium]